MTEFVENTSSAFVLKVYEIVLFALTHFHILAFRKIQCSKFARFHTVFFSQTGLEGEYLLGSIGNQKS